MLVSEQHERMKICVDCMASQRTAAGLPVDGGEAASPVRHFGMRVSAYQEATKAVDELGLKSTARKKQKALLVAGKLAKAIKDRKLWEAFSQANQRMKAAVAIHGTAHVE